MPIDGVRERCGVFAVRSQRCAVARLTYYGLVALQHRGQESAAIVVGNGGRLRRFGGMGLVQEVFAEEDLDALHGSVAVGHVRYATAGGSVADNIQPLLGCTRTGQRFALAHNGNLLSVAGRTGLARRRWSGHDSAAPADTQVLVDAIAERRGSLLEALRAVLPATGGAYSLALATGDTVFAARDRHGFRPLCLGRLPAGDWVVASESAALDSVGARYLREVEPGELVIIDAGGLRSERFAPAQPAGCMFELVYFARPDSLIGGARVQQVRYALGTQLAAEAPADADIVVPVPETARPAALGYAARSGIRYGDGLVRNNYIGRTFIKPNDAERRLAIRLKVNPIPEVVAGRRVVVVDDSIVRANSARAVVAMLRAAGAAEVHVRVASAPLRWPCFFGVDMSTREELAASRYSTAEIAELIGADSLGYLSVAGMVHAASGGPVCTGCFTGVYPVDRATLVAGGAAVVDDPRAASSRNVPIVDSFTY